MSEKRELLTPEVCVRIERSLWKELRHLAIDDNLSLNQLMDLIVRDYLARRKKKGVQDE